ncbi:MAG: hypothetical protein ABSB89_10895 [Candidatus Bathyarchaeia archaeon]
MDPLRGSITSDVCEKEGVAPSTCKPQPLINGPRIMAGEGKLVIPENLITNVNDATPTKLPS